MTNKITTNITVDAAYEAVAPDDFPAMMEVDRYGKRSTAFDKIISATHDHFWDPQDPKYVDFSAPFDMENEYLMDPEQNPDLKTAVKDKLDEKQKIKLVNMDVQWALSSILHG
ncbi:MAG: ferritin-like domain-containing protein, partial [Alphaproteobacteria bacterium]|nr:ferritin-like domain-containing protein [Alphaproteobacteria bacterium]MDX5415475.1 ferritin-like domain-containing protein [Alphaproteobacteria bacterium]MDX5492706.1 ferritin-like domain-containing protein [Alphaproteobacteria bacterium]